MSKALFSRHYYDALMEEFKCNPLEFEPISFSIGSLTQQELQRKWLCHQNGNAFARACNSGKKVIATTGFGMSGVPHMGTLAQILRALNLQQAGIPVQIVLGDLDAYNGRNMEIEKTHELAVKFRQFIINLGFKDTYPSCLRTQYESLNTLRTAFLLGRFMDDEAFSKTEEDLHAFYAKHGKVDPSMTYRRKLSTNLMVADFLELLLEKGFDAVLVAFGLDEHRYAMFGRDVFNRVIAGDPQRYAGKHYAAIYSGVMAGFNGYPQMSKSFPDSGITVDMSYNKICELIDNGEVVTSSPDTNIIYQMISFVSQYDGEQIKEAYDECAKQSDRWRSLKREYTTHLAHLCEQWNNT